MWISLSIIVTFFITAVWQLLAARKIRANQRFIVVALVKEFDQMAIKLGYKDFASYLEATKGAEYASNAMQNLNSFYGSFADKGPD